MLPNDFADICFVSRVFQRVNDLPPTGELDEATLNVMRQPRCGMEDPFAKKYYKYRVMGESSITKLSANSSFGFYCQQIVHLDFGFVCSLKQVIIGLLTSQTAQVNYTVTCPAV